MFRVILGLGGNIGDTQKLFADCLATFAMDGRVVAVSRLWRTRPVGPPQADYVNAAVVIEWPAGPHDLHARCQELERLAGRDRSREERWGPRALDLDLLLATSLVCRGPSLELPHPRLHERAFALGPAAEVAPNWLHPLLGRTIADLARQAIDDDLGAIVEVFDFEF
jgi:2-amino-4-hydroxy-6-hydroxymethyldihydropteridine diphosphokinase